MHANSLPQLLAGGESETVEFKESLQEEALQAIGAFANHRGGTLLIGVTDAGVPIGVVVGKATVREIIDRIASCTEPRVVPDVQVVTLNDRHIIVVQVPEYPIKPVAVRGRCYRRVDSSNRQLSPTAIAEMHLASTGTSWDAQLAPGKSAQDLNLDRVRTYMNLATGVGRRNFPAGADPLEILEKLELLQDGHPTWAALLLFGKRPQSPLVQATVHCGRFRTETDIVDDRLIEGSVRVEENSGGFLFTFHKHPATPEMLTHPGTGPVTPQVTPQVCAVLQAAEQDVAATVLQAAAGLKDRMHFLKAYLEPCLRTGWLEYTIPAKPKSRLQKYRLTAKGRTWLAQQGEIRRDAPSERYPKDNLNDSPRKSRSAKSNERINEPCK